MNSKVYTVEDCLELITGLVKGSPTFKLDSSDVSILSSIARQVSRGIPMTDRQYELVKEKLIKYVEQFSNFGYDIETPINTLRIPLRTIDRSRWIKLVERNDSLSIAVRFIFQKKLISHLENLKKVVQEDHYDKENKIHYFPFSERNVYEIIFAFKKVSGFEIQKELEEYYNKLENMNNNRENYLPGIYKLKLKNLHEKSLNYAITSIGEPSIDNLYQFYDKKDHFGLHHFDDIEVQQSLKTLTPLSKKIVLRTLGQVLINNKQYTIENLAESILELYRFPLLIVLNEKTCHDELIQFHRAFNGIIPNDSCSVMFRLDNDEGFDFNQYIKQHNLNSPVDKHTKIVYINGNKQLPKPLLKSEWQPVTAVTVHSGYKGGTNKVESYLNTVDLVIHYDDDISPWKRNQIEKI